MHAAQQLCSKVVAVLLPAPTMTTPATYAWSKLCLQLSLPEATAVLRLAEPSERKACCLGCSGAAAAGSLGGSGRCSGRSHSTRRSRGRRRVHATPSGMFSQLLSMLSVLATLSASSGAWENSFWASSLWACNKHACARDAALCDGTNLLCFSN
jgi:hypothetical protein